MENLHNKFKPDEFYKDIKHNDSIVILKVYGQYMDTKSLKTGDLIQYSIEGSKNLIKI